MADAKKPEVEVAVAPPKKKGKWLLFAVIGIVGLAQGGGGTFLLVRKQSQTVSADSAEATAREAATKKKGRPGRSPGFLQVRQSLYCQIADGAAGGLLAD